MGRWGGAHLASSIALCRGARCQRRVELALQARRSGARRGQLHLEDGAQLPVLVAVRLPVPLHFLLHAHSLRFEHSWYIPVARP